MKSLSIFLLTLLPFTALAQDFTSFSRILEKHLEVTALPGGGLQTAFRYQEAFDNKTTLGDIQRQSEILKNFDIKTVTQKEQAIAFWINCYNFFMLKIILERGFKKGKREVDSVKDFGSFFNPYEIFKKEINDIGGKKYSLDQIEKGTLLGEDYKNKGWKDARIHFAVNCASVGCPPLVREIYTAENLNRLLDENVKKAMLTQRHLHIEGDILHLTHLFKWYKNDFEEAAGSVKEFVTRSIQDPSLLQKVKATKDIQFIEYDWKLNRPANFKQ